MTEVMALLSWKIVFVPCHVRKIEVRECTELVVCFCRQHDFRAPHRALLNMHLSQCCDKAFHGRTFGGSEPAKLSEELLGVECWIQASCVLTLPCTETPCCERSQGSSQ